MSFILDALKKSESDRQRQTGPALFEVKVGPPRTHLPAWAIAIAALLVVNLGIVMWMLLRHAAHPEVPGTEGRAAVSAAAPASLPSAAPVPPAAAAAPQGPPAAGATAPTLSAPAATSVTAETAARAGASAAGAPAAPAAVAPAGSAAGASAGATPGAAGEAIPDDYAPAEEPPPTSSFGGRVRRGTGSGVPLYQDAATPSGTQLPPLRLDLHVFAVRPQDRFVMINMHKLREGDTLPEGVHVDSITPEGAVLSYNGSRFLLPRE